MLSRRMQLIFICGPVASETARLPAIEDENRRLKKLLAE